MNQTARTWLKNIKLVIPITIVTFLLIIVALLFRNYLSSMLELEVENKLLEVTTQSKYLFEERLANRLTSLSVLAASLAEGNKQKWDLQSIIKQEEAKNGYFQIGAIYLNGQAIYGNTINKQLLPLFMDTFRGHEKVRYLEKSSFTQNNCLLLSVPIYHKGYVIGAVYGIYQNKSMTDLFSCNVFNGDGFTFCLGNNFQSVILSNKDRFLHNNSIINAIQTHEDIAAFNCLKNKLYRYGQGVEKFNDSAGQRYISCVPMQTLQGWYVVSQIPASSVTRQVQTVLWITSSIILFLIGLFLAVFWFIGANDRKNQKEIYRLAYIDRLTGLANWEKCQKDSLDLPPTEKFVLVAMDIDEFHMLNRIMGEAYGDNVLKKIAQCLTDVLQSHEIVCRVKDDLFVLIIHHQQIQQTTNRLEKIIQEIVNLSDNYPITLSCGVIPLEPHTKITNTLLDACLLAKATVKKQVENKIAYYDEQFNKQQTENKLLENSLEQGIAQDEFFICLQPKVNLKTQTWAGAEALVRWNHPQYGLLSPARFIPVFEECGRIGELDLYLLGQICQILRRWIDAGLTPLPISINLSRAHLGNRNLVRDLWNITQQYDIPVHLIELELTESAFFEDTDWLLTVMEQLKEKGFRLSLDDFGTGYSSLAMVFEMPLDTIKLDKSFVDSWEKKQNSILLKDLFTLIENLNITMLTEGIETKQQAAMLQNAGCQLGQGYFYSKPILPTEYEKLVYGKTIGDE